MNIPDKATLEKYRRIMGNEPPAGNYVNLDWDESTFPNNLKKVLYSFKCRFIYGANIKKIRSINRRYKTHNS